MKDSEPPDKCSILEASLEEIKRNHVSLVNSVNKFTEKSSKTNKYNKLKYDVLYKNLGDFYKLIISLSYLDVHDFPIEERVAMATKKDFANDIKIGFSDLLIKLEELQHLEERSPFYEE